MSIPLKILGPCVLALLCLAAIPRPPGFRVESPKGSEQRKSLARVPSAPAAPRAIVVPGKTIAWDYVANGADNATSNIVFIVRSSADLTQHLLIWPMVATVSTNSYAFPVNLPMNFFWVQSSNVVTHLVSK